MMDESLVIGRGYSTGRRMEAAEIEDLCVQRVRQHGAGG